MALKISEPPAGSLEALSDVSRLLTPSGGALKVAAAKASPKEAQLSLAPHRVFVVGLDDLLSGAPAAKARPTGWRYLLESTSAAPTAAEVASDEAKGGSSHQLAKLHEGGLAERTAGWLARLSKEEAVSGFEFRALRVPALGVFALWLKAGGAQEDVFIPLAGPSRLELDAPYAASNWWSLLEEAARAKPQFDDRPVMPPAEGQY